MKYCPNCNTRLEEGEGLIHTFGKGDVTEPFLVCYKCETVWEFEDEK